MNDRNSKPPLGDLGVIDFILSELKSISEPEYLKKMAHFGIDVSKAYGSRVPNIRKLAKQIGKNQELSLLLWETGFHEVRLLATFIGRRTKPASSRESCLRMAIGMTGDSSILVAWPCGRKS